MCLYVRAYTYISQPCARMYPDTYVHLLVHCWYSSACWLAACTPLATSVQHTRAYICGSTAIGGASGGIVALVGRFTRKKLKTGLRASVKDDGTMRGELE